MKKANSDGQPFRTDSPISKLSILLILLLDGFDYRRFFAPFSLFNWDESSGACVSPNFKSAGFLFSYHNSFSILLFAKFHDCSGIGFLFLIDFVERLYGNALVKHIFQLSRIHREFLCETVKSYLVT